MERLGLVLVEGSYGMQEGGLFGLDISFEMDYAVFWDAVLSKQ